MSKSTSRRPRKGRGSSRASGIARKSAPRARFRWELRLVSLALAILVVATGAIGLARSRSWPGSLQNAPVRGVRLGMTMEDARAAFVDSAAGDWSTPPGCYATALEWTRTAVGATQTRWARFEFHQGGVVAIRVLSDAPPPRTRQFVVTPAIVSETRAGADGSTSTTVLSRECEMHAPEVRQLIAVTGEHFN